MKKAFLLIASSVILFSCNDATETTNTTTDDAEHVHHVENQTGSLELNNGERWIVNEEMKPPVLKGEEVVKEYILREKDDYKALATDLKDFNNAVIESCTMEGKSHEELHKWLHPHIELVLSLEIADDQDKAQELISELNKSYETYHQYFQ